MERSDQQKIYDICEQLKTANKVEDFVMIQGLISNIFSNKTTDEIDVLLADRDNFYINLIENVFNNGAFIEAIGKVLEQFQSFQKNYEPIPGKTFKNAFDEVEIKNKKLIFISLVTSLMLFSSVLPNLKRANVTYTAGRLRASIGKIKHIFNQQFSSLEIFSVISEIG